MTNVVRIGNAQAFWGDRSDAAAELLSHEPDLDYLTLDYLAEVSMSILARQREKDPYAGYARDFVDVVRSLASYWAAGGRCRLIANAGGLNPLGCAQACQRALEEANCRSLRIAVVSGDDVLGQAQSAATSASSNEFANLDTAAPISSIGDRLVTANAYLCAGPVVECLNRGADIVISGRVADPSLVVAACLHHFGWREDDYVRLAGATVAGHLIECGTQVTGGISTDWLDIPDVAHIGFPVVEVAEDGSCTVTKPRGTGGQVTEATVKEQLVYEIGDPDRYLSPDATVSFLSLHVEDEGDDRVRVSGAIGSAPPETLKVSATYRDGYRAAGSLTIVGRDAAEKARRCGDIVLTRLREAGVEIRDSVVECIGGPWEVTMRIAVESSSREAVERFTREIMPLITAGPQGTTGYAEGRPRVHSVFSYWPAVIDRAAVVPRIESLVTRERKAPPATTEPRMIRREVSRGKTDGGMDSLPAQGGKAVPSTLYDIASARSGDKGIHANVGVIARDAANWEFLRDWLTERRVADCFAALNPDTVERFELPNLRALNFILRGVLRGGLRNDAQGKTFGQRLLQMPLPDDTRIIPANERSQE